MNDSRIKIIGVVVKYNYTEKEVWENILTYLEALDELLVIDNTEFTTDANTSNYFKECDKIKYIRLNNNMGLGYALNLAVDRMIETKSDWLLTMDQDSNFGSIANFKEYILNIEKKNSKEEVIFCPSYFGEHDGSQQFFTSGSLISTKAIKKIGHFNEDLFIDEIDGDFIYRAKKNNVRLEKINNIHLHHKLGNEISRYFFGRKIISSNHSALRKYYISRNRTYLMIRRPDMFYKYFIDSLHKFLAMLILEKSLPSKIKNIGIGIYHGIIGKLGKR